MTITIDEGVIALDSTVDGVDYATLRGKVVSHAHTVTGDVDEVEEDLQAQAVGGGGRNFYTASNSEGTSNLKTEGAHSNSPSKRKHDHTSGTLATDDTLGSTVLTPSGVVVEINGVKGNIECRTIDGYAPEVDYDWYRDHYHDMTGNTGSTNLPARQVYGDSGNAYFRMRPSGGGDAFWGTAWISSGSHSHGVGTCRFRALGAAAGCAGPEDGVVSVDGDGGTIALGGNVNDIGIAEFKTAYDAHTHLGSTSAAHKTAAGGGGASAMRDSGGTVREFDDGLGNFSQAEIQAVGGGHEHTCAALTSGAPL